MSRNVLLGPAALLALGTLAGCASVSPKPGYAEVAKRVGERGGIASPWDQHAPEDLEVAQRVRALLAKGLTPDAAVEVALLRNRTLQATYESVGVAQADLVQAGLLRNPTLGASVAFPTGSGLTSLQGSLTEDFLALFTIPLRKRFAARELERAELSVGAAVIDLSAEVRAAFYRVQAAQQMLQLWRNLVDAESSAAELAMRQYQAGNIPELDYQNRRALYEQERLELARAEADLVAAREALTRKMGVWGEEADWRIDATLPELPAAEPKAEHLESTAIAQRLDLAAARAETGSLAQALSLAGDTRFLGSFDLGVRAERDPEGNRVVGPSVSLELPVFDQHQAQIARLEAQARAALARQQELAIEIRSEVRLASNRLATARAVVEHYRTVLLPLRERIVQLSQEKYNAMLLGVYGLLQAKQSEIAAYRDYIQAVRDYWVARADLERAVGGKLPPTPNPSPAASHGTATAPLSRNP